MSVSQTTRISMVATWYEVEETVKDEMVWWGRKRHKVTGEYFWGLNSQISFSYSSDGIYNSWLSLVYFHGFYAYSTTLEALTWNVKKWFKTVNLTGDKVMRVKRSFCLILVGDHLWFMN